MSDGDGSCGLRRARLRGRRESSYCGYPQTDGGEDHVCSTPMASRRLTSHDGHVTYRDTGMTMYYCDVMCLPYSGKLLQGLMFAIFTIQPNS